MPLCKLEKQIFQMRIIRTPKRRYFAMKAIKKYFAEILLEYGKILEHGCTIVNI